MRGERKSALLERRLTRRMVQLQAVILVLFFGFVVFPLGVLPAFSIFGAARPQDPANTEIFAEAITVEPGGALGVEVTPKLEALVERHPKAWFYAGTAAGNSVSYGEIPSAYSSILDSLWSFKVGMIQPGRDSDMSSLQFAKRESAAGPVMVASGAGPTVSSVPSIIASFWTAISVALFAVLSIAAVLIVPRLIRRELRGLKSAAEQAGRIDINARGTRLPSSDVPGEIRTLVDAVNGGLERLDTSYELRERFLADAAHELRTPIAILQTRLETAEPFPAQARLLMDVARLSSLADQLLDLQRLDLGELEMGPVDLVAVAVTVVSDMAPLAINAGYDIALDAPEQSVFVRGAEGSLNRALANVVQNAIIHGEHRGQIAVTVRPSGEVSVSDGGPGVAPDQRDRIFEPFYRTKPRTRGAGLGLHLVASIIQMHSGRVTVTESPQGGACFVMSLPLLRAELAA
jgi:signal transduction histidine kinase